MKLRNIYNKVENKDESIRVIKWFWRVYWGGSYYKNPRGSSKT